MSAVTPIARLGVRGAPAERAMWERVTAQLNEGLRGTCHLDLVWNSDLNAAAAAQCELQCLSMLSELGGERSEWPAIEAQWRRAAAALRDGAQARGASVFVLTLLRYASGSDAALLPMARRLNLLATRLSQEFGINVIDIDRAIANLGAINLKAEVRLTSTDAQHVVGDLIVETLLKNGVERVADPDAIEAAMNAHHERRGAAEEAARVASNGLFSPKTARVHDVYGGIYSLLQDLCVPRLGLRWRLPLMRALWSMSANRLSGRFGRNRT